MDEPRLYNYDLETKQQSMEWQQSSSTCPKKFRVQKPTGNVIVTIFWDQDGIIHFDYLPKGQTIKAEYYSSLLVQQVLFLHDNAPANRVLATQKKLAYLGFQCIDHPPSSPDQAPSDYHLFSD